jgi:hypothetical protein
MFKLLNDSDGEMNKIKLVDSHEIYNFIIGNFSFEINYDLKILFELLIL